LFRLMLATGLRREEALALHWSDVDLDGGALRVRWTLTRTSKGVQLGEPKTEKSRRAVPLPRSAVDVLRAHQTRQATAETRPRKGGGTATWSSPPRSARRSSPATCCGGSSYWLNGPASAASRGGRSERPTRP
jgi:integrase